MNRRFFKQFAIALLLFLLGYFTFNNKLFAQNVEQGLAQNAELQSRYSAHNLALIPSSAEFVF